MKARRSALVLALLLAPASVLGQQGGPPPAATAAHVGPIERLLQQRQELALTPEQVQKLEAIQKASAEQERTLLARITEARGGVAPGTPLRAHAATPAERQAMQQKMQAAQPYFAQLRQLHQQQMVQARAILTADQNARARFGFRHQGQGQGPGMMRHGGMRHGGGAGPRGRR